MNQFLKFSSSTQILSRVRIELFFDLSFSKSSYSGYGWMNWRTLKAEKFIILGHCQLKSWPGQDLSWVWHTPTPLSSPLNGQDIPVREVEQAIRGAWTSTSSLRIRRIEILVKVIRIIEAEKLLWEVDGFNNSIVHILFVLHYFKTENCFISTTSIAKPFRFFLMECLKANCPLIKKPF